MRTKNIYPTQLVIKRQTVKKESGGDVEAFLKATRNIAFLPLYTAGGREVSASVSTPVKLGSQVFYPNKLTMNISAISDLKSGREINVPFGPITGKAPAAEFNVGALASLPNVVTDVDVVEQEWNTIVDERNRYTFSKYKVTGTERANVIPADVVSALQNMYSYWVWDTNDVLEFTNDQSNRVLIIKAGPNFPSGTVNAPLTIITDLR